MSPDKKNDEKEPREGPPADREEASKSAQAPKSGKTKSTVRRDQRTSAPAPTKRSSTRAPKMPTESKTPTPMPVDQQDELPPHGDALMTHTGEPRGRGGKPRGRAAEPRPTDLLPPPHELARLLAGEHAQPHDILGAHALSVGDTSGVVFRALMPNARAAEAVLEDGRLIPLDVVVSGLTNVYCGFAADATLPLPYRLRFHFADGAVWERDDPYRFMPTLGMNR